MLKARRGWLVPLLCVAFAAVGCCKKKLAEDGEEAPTPVASNDPGIEDPGESHRDSKVDRTIKCFNAAMQINKSASQYFKRLRGGTPRAGRVPSLLFKPVDSTHQLCLEARADSTPPMPEIDRIMPRYVDLIGELSKQLDQMDKYYKARGYVSDNYKKGKEMHRVFKKDHEEFQKLHEALSEAIDDVTDKRDDESIERESKAKGLRYYSLVFLRDTKMLSREITKDKPDRARFFELRARIEASHKALLEHASAHPDQVEKAHMFSMYKGRSETFMESVRNADPNKLRDRDLDDMLNKYNSMIDASNLVRWRQ